ncbi:hypothetical protein ASPACDRAFT_46795 [Aspergillus aculeatus ATCC 16872]|uniref:Carboxylesterase type B domain-containing protein n=1 Tax=Aspergillus aculeatus (strain ATCC 16872 / CBS 172.66 / WB 5094) TaxID=690307 RepID=A0A1L9WKD9_ASPA1|nr:uncharacterized protein ASPACDRAFT_46795 [Aspergillus aculeatus ATCC 16872]OJJ96624.1 hypothetical protein ASPACDRAFT_46795 [Aspergillus aculeatus ATCC 16872]
MSSLTRSSSPATHYPAGHDPRRPQPYHSSSGTSRTALRATRFHRVPTLVTYNHNKYGLFLQENSTFTDTPTNFSMAKTYLSNFLLGADHTNATRDLDTAFVDFTSNHWSRCNGATYAGGLEAHNPEVWELTWKVNVPEFIPGRLCDTGTGRVCRGSELISDLWVRSVAHISVGALQTAGYWKRARGRLNLMLDLCGRGFGSRVGVGTARIIWCIGGTSRLYGREG